MVKVITRPVARRRVVKVELTEAQMDALRAAVDNHGLFLMDNVESSPRLRRQLQSLSTAWAKIEAAWYRPGRRKSETKW